MLNYRHLYYFWIVVKEGGFARAAGRGVVMTEAGEQAFDRAEQIFQLGEALLDEMREASGADSVRLAVGLSDGISKLAAHALLAPVLACQPAPHGADLRVLSQRVAGSPVDWYGPAQVVRKSARDGFPLCLADLPVLLTTRHGALRARLDRWFESQGIRPRVVGEFEDSALMAVFAARGLGVFPLAELGAEDLTLLKGLRWLGRADGVIEEIHAIRSRRGQHHALTSQVIAAAQS
ncbi:MULTISPECIES: LysR substrate-binding domain-containing protein [unclassified Paraburkholderia]|uniref:LysR substrate-binding domain-containing protein n=1 Tax=unclassified Paraburkholderia TaxID=2615204 RepID=UPI001607DEE0|nr:MULTISPECIES: LysR substrate-binding domain-containing protein [unclassified Paraburkholderia]MBB5444569.1 LysR family transcriptional activator of nhaA [Paraburkholderia sp. WSM4177]MBB5485393.1 LysR family transcriptional activator of nhaA [Paraburkholderia sp. WSM4180]